MANLIKIIKIMASHIRDCSGPKRSKNSAQVILDNFSLNFFLILNLIYYYPFENIDHTITYLSLFDKIIKKKIYF